VPRLKPTEARFKLNLKATHEPAALDPALDPALNATLDAALDALRQDLLLERAHGRHSFCVGAPDLSALGGGWGGARHALDVAPEVVFGRAAPKANQQVEPPHHFVPELGPAGHRHEGQSAEQQPIFVRLTMGQRRLWQAGEVDEDRLQLDQAWERPPVAALLRERPRARPGLRPLIKHDGDHCR